MLVIFHIAYPCMVLGGYTMADHSDFHVCFRDWSEEVVVACLRNGVRHLI